MVELEIRVQGIHTNNDLLFLNKNIIEIGWKEIGDISKLPPNRESFNEKYAEVYPDAKKEISQVVQECFIDFYMKYWMKNAKI